MYRRRFGLPSPDVKEVVYLVFVKCSKFPVFPFMFGHDVDPAGAVFISNISVCELDIDSTLVAAASYHELTSEVGFDGSYESIKDGDFLNDFDAFCNFRAVDFKGSSFKELFVQAEVMCSIEIGVAKLESEHIVDRLHELFMENPVINKIFKVFLYRCDRVIDNTGVYKMAPDGFQRFTMTFSFLLAEVS